MVDIIAGDGDTTDIVAGDGDRVFVNGDVEFLARILGTSTAQPGVSVFVDGSVATGDIFAGPGAIDFAISLTGADSALVIGDTGVVSAENAMLLSGDAGQFENRGRITNGVNDAATSELSQGVNVALESGSFLNSGIIGANRADFDFGVYFGPLDGFGPVGDLTAQNAGTIRGDVGVFMDAAGLQFDNTGRIDGETIGVVLSEAGQTLHNTGTIKGFAEIEADVAFEPLRVAVALDGEGGTYVNDGRTLGTVLVTDADATVINNDLIRGDNFGVYFSAQDPTEGFELVNSGTIRTTGDTTPDEFWGGAISIDGDSVRIVNDGKIIGAEAGIAWRGDAGDLVNNGRIEGVVVVETSNFCAQYRHDCGVYRFRRVPVWVGGDPETQ